MFMNRYIQSDLFRYYGKYDILTFIKALIINKSFRVQYSYRLCDCRGVRYIGFMLYIFFRGGNRIPKSVKIGYGLYIGHGGPVIINPTAVIGNNVNLSQFTTIGSNEGKAAIIGDNVYIGPQVVLLQNLFQIMLQQLVIMQRLLIIIIQENI